MQFLQATNVIELIHLIMSKWGFAYLSGTSKCSKKANCIGLYRPPEKSLWTAEEKQKTIPNANHCLAQLNARIGQALLLFFSFFKFHTDLIKSEVKEWKRLWHLSLRVNGWLCHYRINGNRFWHFDGISTYIYATVPETQLFKTEPIQLYLFESKAKQIQQM